LIFFDPPYNQKKDYGVYKDNLTDENYEKFIKKVLKEVRRISNNKLSVFISNKLTRFFWNLIPDSHLIIIKKFGTSAPHNNYYVTWHPLLTNIKPNENIYDLWEDVRLPGEGYFFREERFDNPGFTSQKLTEYVVRYFSQENQIILDPFLGSGTTAVACKKLNRRFIGIEINPEYCKIAEERLKKVPKRLDKFVV